jgi:hypothetical protein
MTTSHRSSPLRLLPLLASLLLAVGCYEAGQFTTEQRAGWDDDTTGDDLFGDQPTSEETAEDFDWSTVAEPELVDGVELVEEHPCFESVTETYAGDSEELIFTFACDPANVGLEVGDIVVGEANGGYLRQIVSMETSGWVVVARTVQASLEQVLVDGGFFEVLDLDEARYTMDFSGTSLYSGSHGGADVSVQLSEGVVDITPRLTLGAQFGWFRLKRADAILDLDFEADLELLAQISDSVHFDGEVPLGTWSYPFAFAAGPIPVAGTLEVQLSAGFETGAEAQATATVGVEADADVRVGGRYRNGSWYFVNSKSFDAHRTGPDFDVQGDWDGKVWVRAEARVMLYKVAGPSFGVQPYLRGEAEAECYDLDWQFWAGAEADAGINLDVFVFELEHSWGPWTWETEIGDGTIELPFPLGTECEDVGPAVCPEPVGTISCGQVVSGDTSSAEGVASMDAYPINVGNYEAPELVYEWQSSGGGEVEIRFIDPHPTQINHDIMVIDGAAGQCMNMNAVDWGLNSLTFEPNGGLYYIVVDGYDGDAGAFQLTIDCDL